MKRLLAIIPVILLSGCLATIDPPPARHFPEIPDELKVACPDLALVDESTTKLSDVITVVTNNYEQYKECKIKVDSWIQWYNSQKTIFESVK